MAFLKIEKFSFKYALSQEYALRDVSLEIEQGEFILLCGPSGCGKTTLLRHFKQELRPAGARSGSILYDGTPVGSLPALRSAAEVGLVMQDPDSSIVTDAVWHELAFGLENLGLDSAVIKRRVAEMASFFGIGSWFHKKTGELSGGQKQMLNLASILAMQPRLLLLDEPTAMLDPVAAREFIEMAARLNREFGITIVMAGHRLEEVFHLATRVVFMRDGRVGYFDRPNSMGGFIAQNPQYLCYMPAAMQICAQTGNDLMSEYPITVNDGKSYLCGLIGNAKIPQAQPEPEFNGRGVPAIECKGLWFRYEKGTPDVLKDLSMKAYSGELCCILGENGSGKSTLLNLLAGLLVPMHGSVVLNGVNISKLGSRELYLNNIALLPQNPKALFVCDSLLDDLKASAMAAGVVDDDEINAVVADLGLDGLLNRHPYDLSGGESKRAAIAKLLLQRPLLLLLDEPTSGLDACAKASLAATLLGLCDKGMGVLIITHDIEFAAEYAHRCLLLFDGAAVGKGTPRQFFGGNFFYTTAANRMARDIDKGAITCEDVIKLCKSAL